MPYFEPIPVTDEGGLKLRCGRIWTVVRRCTRTLRRLEIEIPAEDLAHLSPYPTDRVKRFGEYPVSIQTESMPLYRELPRGTRSALVPAA